MVSTIERSCRRRTEDMRRLGIEIRISVEEKDCQGFVSKVIIAAFLAQISPMLDFNVNRVYFFYFVIWIS